MATVICLSCGEKIRKAKNAQKRHKRCEKLYRKLKNKEFKLENKEDLKIDSKRYYRKHRKAQVAAGLRYYRKHRAKILIKRKKYRDSNAEIVSVRNHYYNIINSTGSNRGYSGMVFFDGWNPEKGGSFKAAALWIIENIGKRPKGSSLHIIEHEKGFVPNNLEWTYPRKQNNQQMYKIIAQQKHRIKQLEKKIDVLKRKS